MSPSRGFAAGTTTRNGFGTAPMPAGPRADEVFFGGGQVAAAKGPVSGSVVQSDMDQAARDMTTAIQLSQ